MFNFSPNDSPSWNLFRFASNDWWDFKNKEGRTFIQKVRTNIKFQCLPGPENNNNLFHYMGMGNQK